MKRLLASLNAYDPAWLPIAVVAIVCLVSAFCARRYVQVWESELTLWRHAAAHAPRKPRPMLNYGVALLRAGRRDEATRAFVIAHELALQPHVPAWDRRETLSATRANLEALAVMSLRERRP